MPDTIIELSNERNCIAIVPAAGSGKRFGKKKAKQYQSINGQQILDVTLEIFINSPRISKVLLIVSPADEFFNSLNSINNEKLIVVDGGDERQSSVYNGLRFLYDNGLPDECPVLVHDAVRPCLSEVDLNKLLDYFDETKQPCFLADKVVDSLKKIGQDNQVLQSASRDELICALTPQMAAFIDLKKSLSQVIKSGIIVTDEVGALTDNDIEVFAVFANDLNPKITVEKDLKLAEQILNARQPG